MLLRQRFLELETLAPVSTIPPDGSVTHMETWKCSGISIFPPKNAPYRRCGKTWVWTGKECDL